MRSRGSLIISPLGCGGGELCTTCVALIVLKPLLAALILVLLMLLLVSEEAREASEMAASTVLTISGWRGMDRPAVTIVVVGVSGDGRGAIGVEAGTGMLADVNIGTEVSTVLLLLLLAVGFAIPDASVLSTTLLVAVSLVAKILFVLMGRRWVPYGASLPSSTASHTLSVAVQSCGVTWIICKMVQ